ncbi:predicted protein [Nematostella vectensis]|uniref:E3 ubiquitin protein ligase n=1 Tax=Nematostella vectensis TaxID=45351 RepID=A7T3C3_NEMVE|nr:predicted protein [Nematostella vectensis]|eukprot:XP_001621643.1 hypothetical protein NEMVEDRAFT_v1g248658 [Nematostella vectensis]
MATHKKYKSEVNELHDALLLGKREYDLMRIEYEQSAKTNEQTGPMIKEMTYMNNSLQSYNKQLKGEVNRYKRKLGEAQNHIQKYHTLYTTIPCTVPYHVHYHTMNSTIPCTVPYHVQYHTMYTTIPCTLPYHVQYHTMYSTIPCTVPYHEQYHTIPCTVPYHVQYHTMYSTIPCSIPYHVHYHTMYTTIP